MEIKLTKGLSALISDCDAEKISKLKWYAMKCKNTFYAASNSSTKSGNNRKTILMHALILGCELADHKDGNGLNNQRENLRRSNRSLNAVNSKIRIGKTSKFRGVVWDKARNKWAAYARIGGKSKNLGRYKTEQEANSAYRKIAVKIYGEFLRN